MSPRAVFSGFSKILLCVLSFSLSLLLAEIAVRVGGFAPAMIKLADDREQTPYFLSDNPILGYELRPNYRDPNPTNHNGRFSYVNSDGQRDTERVVPRVTGKKRIILLGDSVVAGHGQPELDLTISKTLERVLGDGTEVLNFGVGGYTTLAEVELLRVKGLKYRPDAVIVMAVYNDTDQSNGEDFRRYQHQRPRWAEFLFERSSLFRFVALKLDLFHFRLTVQGNWFKSNTAELSNDNAQRGFSVLKELSETHGFRVGVVLWPNFINNRISYDHYVRVEDGTQTLFDALAAQFQFPVLHLVDDFEQDFALRCTHATAESSCQDPMRRYTYDALHANGMGAAVAAAALKPFAEQLLQPDA